MPTNGHDHGEPAVLPPNALDTRTTAGNNNNNDNNQGFNVQDSVLFPLFSKATLGYARMFPRPMRRIFEFELLFMAILSFIVLVYVHMNFSPMPANCLDHVKDVWPRDGVLRVEIIPSFQRIHAERTGTINELLTIEKSYEREDKLKRTNRSEENVSLFNLSAMNNSLKNKGEIDIESTEELVENKFRETSTSEPNFEDEKKEMFSSTTKTNFHNSKSNFSVVEDSAQFRFTKYPNSSIIGVLGIDSLPHSTSSKLPLINDHEVIFYENYIVEYSLEYGFLRLSPSARNRLGIPVLLVVLEPTGNKCFGDSVGRFFLEYFFGYNYLLVSSITSLIENEQNKGFMRNVITGDHYRLASLLTDRTSYIPSFFIMVVFTVLISIILRYAFRQIFVFIVALLRQLEFHGTISFRVLPFLPFVMALVGVQAIMASFFNDSNTAFYIVLTVWAADHFDAMCSYRAITKRHWLKFFYLYHYSFYAYHHRFNGQNSILALTCSWLFILHSMVYFFHRYELPNVLHHAQLETM